MDLDINSSILSSIKKLLNVPVELDHFNQDLIIHINSALSVVTQLGLGPSEGLIITGTGETWSQLTLDSTKIELVKTYIYLKVKSVFDPPTIGAVSQSLEKNISEIEWRIAVIGDKEGHDKDHIKSQYLTNMEEEV